MRGEDIQQQDLFSYGSLEERVPADHPLRPIRAMVDEALKSLDGRFEEIYDEDGRKSIPPERLLRALLLQMFYTIRSERMLMEHLEYNLLFRWFVGLSDNEPVWHPAVFTKNRDRLAAQSAVPEQPASQEQATDNRAATNDPGGSAQMKTPDVQVYIAPDATSAIESARLTEGAIKDAVLNGLSNRHIVCISDNAVDQAMDDWVSVRFSTAVSTILPMRPLSVEISVRNGASAAFQLIRWEGNAAVETSSSKSVLDGVDLLLNNLRNAFGTAAYKKGRMNESPN